MNRATPKISVVIPARNEERWIGLCLSALHAGTTPRSEYEVILVDNGSTDQTVEIARPLVDQIIDLAGVNVSQMRNAAVAEARGEVLAFLDADCIPTPDWLETGLKSLGDENCITGASYVLPENPAPVESLLVSLEAKPTSKEKAKFVPAGNFFIHKAFFNEIGQFDSSLEAGEDKELCARASRSGAVYHDPAIIVAHEGNPKTFHGLFRRELWHGRGILRTVKKNPADKLVIATFLFGIGLLLTIIGALLSIFFVLPGALLALAGIGCLASVLTLSLVNCRKQLRGPVHAFQALEFYVVYFMGRTGALIGAIFSVPYYHNLTSMVRSADDAPAATTEQV
ncbi:MAG: glycosyltransferase [Verrucomicrobiales bacterium]|nr:glycosyltransferase [Verrucomicrobiales bacterium]